MTENAEHLVKCSSDIPISGARDSQNLSEPFYGCIFSVLCMDITNYKGSFISYLLNFVQDPINHLLL